jgi:hypothetical protein
MSKNIKMGNLAGFRTPSWMLQEVKSKHWKVSKLEMFLSYIGMT